MKKELAPKIELSREDKKSLVFLGKRNEASVAAVLEADKHTASHEEAIALREKEIKAAIKKRGTKKYD